MKYIMKKFLTSFLFMFSFSNVQRNPVKCTSLVSSSVSDPYHFDLDPDPDPDPRIRIRDHGSGSGSGSGSEVTFDSVNRIFPE